MNKSVFFWILKNVTGAVLLLVLGAFLCNMLLKFITNHNMTCVVPDFSEMTLAEAIKAADENGMQVKVSDSVFIKTMERGKVYRQMPEAGSYVKKGRRVFLTMNCIIPKKVRMPNLVGLTMRQAKAELLSSNLHLGKLIYVDDIATNNVISQLYRGNEIDKNTQIEIGSKIDLVVGANYTDNFTLVPNVVGLKWEQAVNAIHDNSLNIGTATFARNIKTSKDSVNAVVVSQSPGSDGEIVTMGSNVNITLKLQSKSTSGEQK